MADNVKIRTNYAMEINLLSPLHISSGKGNLIYDYDFVGEKGSVLVIDQDKMLEAITEADLLKMGSIDPTISHFLQPSRYADCTRYQMRNNAQVPKEIVPFVKDIHFRPYVPGSSIKGAIRAALAWAGYGQGGAVLDSRSPHNNNRQADDEYEQRLFGGTAPHDFRRNPNYDLLRALHIADTSFPANKGLELATVTLYTLRQAFQPKGTGYQWNLEVLPKGTSVVGALGIDEYLLGPAAARLGFEKKKEMVRGLATLCNQRARDLVSKEISFYRLQRVASLCQFYEKLNESLQKLAENEFMLQMSWGTGWQAKTLGSKLEDEGVLPEVRDFYRLGRPNAPFPKTRRLVESGNVPEAPLGWVKCTLS